ncbi:hypothetical protein [Sorangium sp. So ce233]|uniref:hypothetical protein n=1 Tax=Sorangium sp. So ce233 TaxID=3133290 RepID=UPI003F5E1B0A
MRVLSSLDGVVAHRFLELGFLRLDCCKRVIEAIQFCLHVLDREEPLCNKFDDALSRDLDLPPLGGEIWLLDLARRPGERGE